MFNELNRRKNTIGIKMSDDAQFIKLGEWAKTHPNTDLVCHGFIITNGGNYGKSVAVVADSMTFVSLPKRYVDWFEARTDEEVKAIMDGKMKLTNIEYITAKNGNQTWSFLFADV